MGDLIKLAADGAVDHRMIVAVDVTPQAGNTIKQFSPIGCLQIATIGALNRQRLIAGHLRKPMPVTGTLLTGSLLTQ